MFVGAQAEPIVLWAQLPQPFSWHLGTLGTLPAPVGIYPTANSSGDGRWLDGRRARA